ncbi:MAG: preprotein translocase subunit SecE [Candidatus Omnitrophota bacterium]
MLKVVRFISQVKTEMKKVAWPTRQELVSSTIVVLVSTILLSLFIGICDMFLSRSVNFLISGVFR